MFNLPTHLNSFPTTHLCSAHPGTSLVRPQDLYLVKCPPPWKNAALRQLHSIVSLAHEHPFPILWFSWPVISEPAILKIFNVRNQKLLHLQSIKCSPCPFEYTSQQDVEDVQYITFLLMARAGLRALEFYDPVTKKHGQAHMQAR